MMAASFTVDRTGLWLRLGGWSFSYWTPWTRLPLSVRHGYRGRLLGRWGAVEVDRG